MNTYTFKEFINEIIVFFNTNHSRTEPLEQSVQLFSKQPKGLYLEYGVYSGQSITTSAKILPEGWDLYGFDSFEGLPEKWRDGFDTGCFSLNGNIPQLYKSNITLIKGWFDQSIIEWKNKYYQYSTVDILHIDCDLYSSAKTVLSYNDELIKPNHTIIVFDELINYPGYEKHELKALYEYCCAKKYNIDMLFCGGYNLEKFALKVSN